MDLKLSYYVQNHREHDKMQIIGPQHGGWYKDFVFLKVSLADVAGLRVSLQDLLT